MVEGTGHVAGGKDLEPSSATRRPSLKPTFAYARVAAGEAAPLLAVAIQPDAEDHEDDPAGGADAGDEGRLLDHVRDLLRQGVLLAHGLGDAARGV